MGVKNDTKRFFFILICGLTSHGRPLRPAKATRSVGSVWPSSCSCETSIESRSSTTSLSAVDCDPHPSPSPEALRTPQRHPHPLWRNLATGGYRGLRHYYLPFLKPRANRPTAGKQKR